MALNSSSRYTTYKDPTTSTLLAFPKDVSSERYSTYVSKAGDSFDLIATRIYRDPTQYWRIANINPHVKFPNEIPVGTQLRIPI
jgi:nucleoid-associated protein YgaU